MTLANRDQHLHGSPPASTDSLTRASMLTLALGALEDAADVRRRGARRVGSAACYWLDRLDVHREVVARRAGNVALAAVVTAEELRELRDACRMLATVRGFAATSALTPA